MIVCERCTEYPHRNIVLHAYYCIIFNYNIPTIIYICSIFYVFMHTFYVYMYTCKT